MTSRTSFRLAHHLGDADAPILRLEGKAEVEVVNEIEEKGISLTTVRGKVGFFSD
jgi:hypothetical protein